MVARAFPSFKSYLCSTFQPPLLLEHAVRSNDWRHCFCHHSLNRTAVFRSSVLLAVVDGQVYIEHGYLYDLKDVEAHKSGRILLKQGGLAENELVDTGTLHISSAELTDGSPNTWSQNLVLSC